MSDPTNQGLSQTGDGKSGPPLWVRIVVGAVASGITGWALNFLSLAGVDFKVLGINSEFVKSTIESLLTGVYIAPECIPLAFATFVFSIRLGWRTAMSGFSKPLPPETKE